MAWYGRTSPTTQRGDGSLQRLVELSRFAAGKFRGLLHREREGE
jgi:hypothetical protein